MEIVEKIIVSEDFTQAPGARYKDDGPKSGEEFFETLLLPKFVSAINQIGILFVDLDDVWGYASSFISGSFGRLSHECSAEKVLKHLELKSEDDPTLLDKIREEIMCPRYESK